MGPNIENYKVHSKLCLITRRKKQQLQYFTQIGTGNYNEKTSEMYTDYSFLTARHEIGIDAVNFFQNMSIGNLKGDYAHLLVAPHSLKSTVLSLIDREIEKAKRGQPSLIRMKMNAMTDRKIIDRLQKASAAGVRVELIIRGICCLLPNVIGYSENIEVHSIVGRYLEHARIYCFGVAEECRLYISSADMMTRNTEKRVEVACPIDDLLLKKRILHDMDLMWRDNVKARIMKNDGTYARIPLQEEKIDAQKMLMSEAEEAAKKAERMREQCVPSFKEQMLRHLLSKIKK